jgi:CheY-like chemotaxis protein
MNPIRLLIVEDEPELLSQLKKLYREIFAEQGASSVIVETADTVEEARELARAATNHPYDLVSLDVNLGDAEKTGLDVLGTLNRFQSAWMVALLTGVETDTSLDKTMGKAAGEVLRKRLRHAAYQKFPAERLVVVEKPTTALPDGEQMRLLADRIRQIALIYGEVSVQRFIFRPIQRKGVVRLASEKGAKAVKRATVPTSSTLWQIRYNCGDMLTVPNKTGFRTLHHLLSTPGSELTLEQAMVLEPVNETKGKTPKSQSCDQAQDPVAEYFSGLGIAWSDLNLEEQEKMIAAALSLRFRRYVELREYQEEDDLSIDEEEELHRLIVEFGPLSDAAEIGFLRTTGRIEPDDSEATLNAKVVQGGLHETGGNHEKAPGQWGFDSRDRQNFSARKSRALKSLREDGFVELADHLEAYVQPNHGKWSYNPPTVIEWLT